MNLFVFLYVVGIVLTYCYTVKTIRNPNDEDRTYAEPPEWDFCHIGASLLFPIFWILSISEKLSKRKDRLEKSIYDRCN